MWCSWMTHQKEYNHQIYRIKNSLAFELNTKKRLRFFFPLALFADLYRLLLLLLFNNLDAHSINIVNSFEKKQNIFFQNFFYKCKLCNVWI